VRLFITFIVALIGLINTGLSVKEHLNYSFEAKVNFIINDSPLGKRVKSFMKRELLDIRDVSIFVNIPIYTISILVLYNKSKMGDLSVYTISVAAFDNYNSLWSQPREHPVMLCDGWQGLKERESKNE